MTEKTKKTKYPKRVLIDDERLQFTVIRRIDELLNKERPIAALIRMISAESGIQLESIQELVRSAKNGENMKLLHYTYLSKHFHFNLCNFFNPDMMNWDKEYTEIDEIENVFKRMARVIEYAKYSKYMLVRTSTFTTGDMYSVFSQPFCRNFQLAVENGYDPDKAPKLSINHVVRLSVLSNIPAYAFFMVDDDAFESILKEKCATAQDVFDRYVSPDRFIGTRREKRQKLILENNPDTVIDASHKRYPIMDPQIRRAIIDHFQMIKDSRGYTYTDIVRGTGLSKTIVRAISMGLNSHLTSYLKVCDFFHVRINDFLNPNIDELPPFRKKNMDIDFYAQFENAFKNARQNAGDLTTADATIKNLYSIWDVFTATPMGDYKDTVTDAKEAAKYKIFLNTLIDFASAMNVTVYDLLSDKSVKPENIELQRLKPNRGRCRIKYVSDNMTVGRLPIDLQELIYDYVCLNDDRKNAVLGVVRFLATKQRAETSGDTETLNWINEQLTALNK